MTSEIFYWAIRVYSSLWFLSYRCPYFQKIWCSPDTSKTTTCWWNGEGEESKSQWIVFVVDVQDAPLKKRITHIPSRQNLLLGASYKYLLPNIKWARTILLSWIVNLTEIRTLQNRRLLTGTMPGSLMNNKGQYAIPWIFLLERKGRLIHPSDALEGRIAETIQI